MILPTFLVFPQHRRNTRLPYRFGGSHLGYLCSPHTILMIHLVGHYMNNRRGNMRSWSFDHLVWRIYRLILLWLCRDLVPRQNKLLPHQPFPYRESSNDVIRGNLTCALVNNSNNNKNNEVKSDHRSKFSNLFSNWKWEAWKNQGFNGIRTRDLRDTGAMITCGFIAQFSGRASHRYRGSHGFESHWSPDFFRLLISNCLNWKINCDDHQSSLSSTTAGQIWIIS